MKHLNIKITKIKDHSNIHENNKADTLANQGRQLDPVYTKANNIPSFKFVPIFQQNTPIDSNLRHFIKFIYLKHNQYSWQLSNATLQLLSSTNAYNINWKATLQVWNPDKGANSAYTSSFHSNIRTYFIKCINQQLPVLELLNTRHPDLYPNNICTRCKIFKESQSHLWTCNHSIPIIKDIIISFTTKLGSLIFKKLKKLKSNHNHKEFYISSSKNFCSKSSFFSLATLAQQHQDNSLQLSHLIYGFVPTTLLLYIKSLELSHSDAITISYKSTFWFALQTKIQIWNNRCKIQIQNDKARHIFKKQKKTNTQIKKKGRPQNSSSSYTSLNKRYSNPNLCKCEFLPEEHENGNCPKSYTPILYSEINITNIIKLKTLSDKLMDPLDSV